MISRVGLIFSTNDSSKSNCTQSVCSPPVICRVPSSHFTGNFYNQFASPENHYVILITDQRIWQKRARVCRTWSQALSFYVRSRLVKSFLTSYRMTTKLFLNETGLSSSGRNLLDTNVIYYCFDDELDWFIMITEFYFINYSPNLNFSLFNQIKT